MTNAFHGRRSVSTLRGSAMALVFSVLILSAACTDGSFFIPDLDDQIEDFFADNDDAPPTLGDEVVTDDDEMDADTPADDMPPADADTPSDNLPSDDDMPSGDDTAPPADDMPADDETPSDDDMPSPDDLDDMTDEGDEPEMMDPPDEPEVPMDDSPEDEPMEDEPTEDEPTEDEPVEDEPAEAEPVADIEAHNDYCAAVSVWETDWAAFESEVLTLVNEERALGADCGSRGTFDPAAALVMNDRLRCAARNHSQDMALNNFFSHTNLDGEGPGDRIELAEYDWTAWGENIAWGQGSPEQVVQAWMNSDGHCANIMNPNFTEIGVGFHQGLLWTQVFGRAP